MSLDAPPISVIIPVWQEKDAINATLRTLAKASGDLPYEAVIVDGDPKASTLAMLQCRHTDVEWQLRCVLSPKGRGNQMNYGARRSIAPLLLFLHADTQLPASALHKILMTMERHPEVVAGAFDLEIDSPRWIFRIISKFASWRSRLTRIPYGDQGIFIRRDAFDAVGGFPDVPLMEDVALMQSLKKRGMKIMFLRETVLTSARRWEKEGIIRCTLRNWCLIILYHLGVHPRILVRFYR